MKSDATEASIVAHYILCNGSDILQELDADAQALIQLAAAQLAQAEEQHNQTVRNDCTPLSLMINGVLFLRTEHYFLGRNFECLHHIVS